MLLSSTDDIVCFHCYGDVLAIASSTTPTCLPLLEHLILDYFIARWLPLDCVQLSWPPPVALLTEVLTVVFIRFLQHLVHRFSTQMLSREGIQIRNHQYLWIDGWVNYGRSTHGYICIGMSNVLSYIYISINDQFMYLDKKAGMSFVRHRWIDG